MSSFWPTGLEFSDMQTPSAILDSAREEWETNSDGALTLVFQQGTTQDDNAIIAVHAKHIPSNRTAILFSVIYRAKAPYPATIQPISENLPDYLKREYYKPGIGEVTFQYLMQGQTVTNEWVSDTPSEFRKKLIAVFNRSNIKTTILNLSSCPPSSTLSGDEQPIKEQPLKE